MNRSIDIAVVGAGAAGVMAACAAASRGARVALIEASDRLGGAVTTAMHRSLCGLYASAPRHPADTLNEGPQRRFIERLAATAPGQVQPKQFGKAWVLEFPSDAYEATLAATLGEMQVDLQMQTRVTDVRREGDRISAIQTGQNVPAGIEDSAARPESPCHEGQWTEINALIDCTGGGQVLKLIGEDAMLPPDSEPMLGGYSLRLGGLTGDLESLRLFVPYALARAVDRGALPPVARFAVFYPGPGADAGVLKLALNAAEPALTAIDLADRIMDTLRADVDGFARASLVERSPHIVARDGRRLRGRTTLTEADILQARTQPIGIRAWWPIERWDAETGPTYQFPSGGDPYTIPPEALCCAVLPNLFAAGSTLSATSHAAASARVSGICLATGALAGDIVCRGKSP